MMHEWVCVWIPVVCLCVRESVSLCVCVCVDTGLAGDPDGTIDLNLTRFHNLFF